VLGDEGVVAQVGVGGVDAVDFFALAGGEGFVFVEAPDAFEEALAAEDLVEAGDAAGESVGGVEEGGIGVGDLHVEAEEVNGDGIADAGELAGLKDLDGLLGPDAPVSEEATDDAAFDVTVADLEAEGGDEVGDDVVVVAGVEGDVVAAGLGDGADDVEGLVAVEGGHLDGDDVLDLGEAAPEGVGEGAAADGGLEVEADDGQDVGDGAAVGDELVVGGGLEGGEGEEAGVVAEIFEEGGFGGGLAGVAADAADSDERGSPEC
jgi:hypothetical protein